MAGVDEADGGGDAQAPPGQFVSLYRRFRPATFAQLRGQPHVVRALQGAVRDERVAHAYLFSGPRGTGKTSTARILARALNCASPADGEPCGTCASCVEIARGTSLDVHELDAASNNGVDAMRDLISHAALATPGRWKIYIVDEVHMLSNAAANALLKTLEEPPGRVVFVLATTDPQKVPPTIKSRTQHFEFGLLGAETLTGLARDVNAAAGLSLDDGALAAAVRKGRGSARDTLSALDQVAASGGAGTGAVNVVELTEAFCEEDARRALVAVAALTESGWGPQQLAAELVDELRQAFLATLAPELAAAQGAELERLTNMAGRLGLARVVRAMEALGRGQVDMRDAPDPRAVLEVALVRLCRPELDDTASALLDRVARLEQVSASAPAPAAGPASVAPVAAPAPGAPPSPPAPSPPAASRARPAPPAPAASSGEAPATPPDPAGRPALGALRRQRAPRPPDPPTPPAAGPEGSPTPGGGPPVAPEVPTGPEPAVPAGQATRGGSPATARPPDRDALVQAWGDHILRGLPALTKALYSAGRFLDASGSGATYALPNATHRERAEEFRPAVEQALAAYFGTPIGLSLVVDDDQPAPGRPPARPGGPADGPGAWGLDPGDEVVAEAPGAVRSAEQAAHDRLLQTFPGAEEVTG